MVDNCAAGIVGWMLCDVTFSCADPCPSGVFEGGFHWVLNAKSFTTGILFVNSLWFYAIRYAPYRERSLFPCMLAHAISNLGVFGIKAVQGYVIFRTFLCLMNRLRVMKPLP